MHQGGFAIERAQKATEKHAWPLIRQSVRPIRQHDQEAEAGEPYLQLVDIVAKVRQSPAHERRCATIESGELDFGINIAH
jgi:hypothetical protein